MFSLELRRRLLFVLWCLGLVAVWFLSPSDPSNRLRGIAHADSLEIAATEDGRIQALSVELHQPVAPGDVVVELDRSALLEERRALAAEAESLELEVPAERLTQMRRLADDLEDAELEVARGEARVSEEEAELAALEQELERDRALSRSGVLPEDRVREKERQISVARARLDASRSTLEQARSILDQARIRRQRSPGANPWPAIAARRQIEEIDRRIAASSLRSTLAGQVSWISASEGETIESGETIAEVTPTETTEVHLYAPTAFADALTLGEALTLRGPMGEKLVGRVASVGADRRLVPEPLWSDSDRPEYGRLVRVALDGASLRPGDLVVASPR